MKILIIEDDSFKLKDAKTELSRIIPGVEIDSGASYSSGLRKALQEKYEVVIIDNSLPRYDAQPYDIQPDMAPLILEEMEEYLPEAKGIICSQYDTGEKEIFFSNITRNYENCIGFVRYDSIDDSWRKELFNLIHQHIIKP